MTMSNETEKLTINLGVVELAQMDVLVEQGIYANRSDCIRTAVRKQLELHRDTIERSMSPLIHHEHVRKVIGIQGITKKMLEELAAKQERLQLRVIGMLIFDSNISKELYQRTIDSVYLRGKLVAPPELKALVKENSH